MLWSLGLLRQSAAAIVLCPRAECVVRLLFWLSGGLISVPSSICWPCLQTGGLESPKMVLRAVGQAAFGSAPSIGNSSYSLVCSTASDTFLSAHTSSQIRFKFLSCAAALSWYSSGFYTDEYMDFSWVTCYFQVLISIYNFCWLTEDFRGRNQKQ